MAVLQTKNKYAVQRMKDASVAVIIRTLLLKRQTSDSCLRSTKRSVFKKTDHEFWPEIEVLTLEKGKQETAAGS